MMRDFSSLVQTMNKLDIHPVLQGVVISKLEGFWGELAPSYNRNQVTAIAGKVVAPLVSRHSSIKIKTIKAEIAAIVEAHYANSSLR